MSDIRLGVDLSELDKALMEILPRVRRGETTEADAEVLEAFTQRYWPAAREEHVKACGELVEWINADRDWLLATDEWELTDEGNWEEFAKPTGCWYGDLAEMKAYAQSLEER